LLVVIEVTGKRQEHRFGRPPSCRDAAVVRQ
jgi:hypothetical protein